jgi:hypothetical protein
MTAPFFSNFLLYNLLFVPMAAPLVGMAANYAATGRPLPKGIMAAPLLFLNFFYSSFCSQGGPSDRNGRQ